MSSRPKPIRRWITAVASASVLALSLLGVGASPVAAASCPVNAANQTTCVLAITYLPGTMPSGTQAPFVVRVTDGQGNTITSGCGAKATITVRVLLGQTTVLSSSVTTSTGVASFPDTTLKLSSLAVNNYTVLAQGVESSGCATLGENSKALGVSLSTKVTCGTTACTTPAITSGGGSSTTITAGAGARIAAGYVAFGAAGFTACTAVTGTYAPHDPNSAFYFYVSGSLVNKTITATLPGATSASICWNQPTAFKAINQTDSKPDLLGGYTGWLPSCSQKTLPCISSVKTNTRTNTAQVVITVGAADPKFRG